MKNNKIKDIKEKFSEENEYDELNNNISMLESLPYSTENGDEIDDIIDEMLNKSYFKLMKMRHQ